MKSTPYYLHVLSALHVGTGQGAGVIDLPIAREKATHLPYVPGTSIKGVLREEMRPDEGFADEDWETLFGPARIKDDTGFAGALAVGDAHLLCLPVRALAGTFAWATCPFILNRFRREAQAAGLDAPTLLSVGDDKTALVTDSSRLTHNDTVVLEDLDLTKEQGAQDWAGYLALRFFAQDEEWQRLFIERFTVLPDAVFDFLAETATEVRARVRISPKTRTVEKGALWYEENLPAETLLYGILAADRARKGAGDAAAMLAKITDSPKRMQLGGKATVGRGIVSFIKQGV